MSKFMLVGPYGGRNIGDNLILELILDDLSDYVSNIVVSCSDPKIVSELYGVDAIPLLEYRSLDVDSARLVKEVDFVIIGGGEQLSEPRIPNPIWGHLARTAHMARIAKSYSVPFMLWSVGLDEIRSKISRFLLNQWIFDQRNSISLRDNGSWKRAKKYCTRENVIIKETADPAFMLQKVDEKNSRVWLLKELEEEDDCRDIVLLVPANDKNTDLKYVDEMISFGKELVAQGKFVVGWITDIQESYDVVLAESRKWLEIPGFKWLPRKLYKKDDFSMIVSGANYVISARMHPLIVAFTQSTEVLVVSRSVKMDAFAEACKLPVLSIKDVTKNNLLMKYSGQYNPSSSESKKLLSHMRNKAGTAKNIFFDRFSVIESKKDF